jgi:uncharacterized protein YkwD
MSRPAQRSRINQLVAIGASLALAGTALVAPQLASAGTSTKHARAASHHRAVAHQAKKATHKVSAKKVTSRSKSASVSHSKAAVQHATKAATPTPTPTPAVCANGAVVPTAGNLTVVRAATLCLINQQRADAGLAPLVENSALDAEAQAHSNDMIATDYFDHAAPNGVDVLARVVSAGFATVADVLDLGENIAAAAGSLASPAATVASWMSSAPHRANVLDPTFRQTGIGVAAAVPAMLGIGSSGATYTQTFGTAG